MSTHIPAPILDIPKAPSIAIVRARWNDHITQALLDGALEVIETSAPDATTAVFEVPGAVELTYAASALSRTGHYEAVIVFGCVIRGDTPHFDYVCDSVTRGVTLLNAEARVPVIFGLLTVNSETQARERLGGSHGHKGREAAQAALEMIALRRAVR